MNVFYMHLLVHPLLLALHAKWWGHAEIPNLKMGFTRREVKINKEYMKPNVNNIYRNQKY